MNFISVHQSKASDNFISIIIVTYNSLEYLKKCLNSIENSPTRTPYEVIVVDNASRDDTADVVPIEYPEVVFIRNEVNLGFAHANNQGIKISKGNFLLLLNPDTLVIDDALDVMAKFLKETPRAGACGCKVLNDDGSLQPSFFGFPTLIKELGHLFRIDRMPWLYRMLKSSSLLGKLARTNVAVLSDSDNVIQVDYLLGACLMMKASVVHEVGPLDDKIFMYIEDTEMCHRIRASGYCVYYVPHGKIVHFGGKSAATEDQRMLMEYTRSRLYFYRKCYGNLSTFALKLIISLDMLFKMIVVWIVKYQQEMQQLQTRYAKISENNSRQSYLSTLPQRLQSFRLYFSILKMVVSY
jgi:GT2 family glycosyltransferase